MLTSDLFYGQKRQNIGLAVFGSPGFAATTPQESAGCLCSAPVPRAAHTAGVFVLRKYPKAPKKILSETLCCWRLSPGSLAEQTGFITPHRPPTPCKRSQLARQACLRVILALCMPNNMDQLLKPHQAPQQSSDLGKC